MLIELLKNEFQLRRNRNPQYSLRAFAKSLKIHSSTLSVILSGKRKISPKQADKILRELNVDQIQKKQILLSIINTPLASTSIPANYETLQDESFSMISSCEHFTLLSCLDLDANGQTAEQLSEKLKIPLRETSECLERLARLQLVNRHENIWQATGRKFATNDNVLSSSVRRVNREYISKALSSLQYHSVEERDISGVTMAISSKKIPMAKKMIANFRREMAEYLEAGNGKDEVYRLNIQLFPLSK